MGVVVRLKVCPAYWHKYETRPVVKRWMWLSVYDTVEELRTAGNAWAGKPGVFDNAGGLCHPQHKNPGNGYSGIIRLVKDCSSEVVAHETMHAAASIWRGEIGSRLDLGKGCAVNEESFAYLYGDLFAGICYQLQQSGVW